MWKMLSVLQKNLVWAIPASMVIGLMYGYWFDASPLKAFIIPVTFIMVYPMMVSLNFRGVLKGRDGKLQITTQVINFVLIPLLAYLTGMLFLSDGPEKYGLWAVGLFLIGVLPTSGMTISWTGFARGNKEAAIKMVVFGLVLGALAAPVYTKLFMGAKVEVDMLHMFQQIVLFVFVPLLAGLVTQAAFKKQMGEAAWRQKIQPKFPPFSALGVVLIAFLAMSLKAKTIIANPGDLLVILGPLAFFYLISYAVLSLVGRLFFSRGDAVAMVFGVVMRDLSIALAIAMTAFGKQGATIALLIALAYVIQIQSAAWYVRLVNKLFGQAPEASPAKGLEKADAGATKVTRLPEPLIAPKESMVPALRKILYATDLSETARHAVRYACSLGSRYGAEVVLLHVIPNAIEELSRGAGVELSEYLNEEERVSFNSEAVGQARETIARRIDQTSRQVKSEIPECPIAADQAMVLVGDPVDQILSVVNEGDFDLVIMGTHGHGGIERAVIGSVAGEVIRRCPAPVLVVRLPADNTGDNQLESSPSDQDQGQAGTSALGGR